MVCFCLTGKYICINVLVTGYISDSDVKYVVLFCIKLCKIILELKAPSTMKKKNVTR